MSVDTKQIHYEMVLMIHPARSDQAESIVQRYQDMVTESKGRVHRYEDWGLRQLAYAVQEARKGHYILMNVECPVATMKEIEHACKFNDAVIRYLVIRKKNAVTTPSPMMSTPSQSRVERRDQDK